MFQGPWVAKETRTHLLGFLVEDLRIPASTVRSPDVLWLDRRDKGDIGDFGVNFTALLGAPSGPGSVLS